MTLSANGLCKAFGDQPVLRDVRFDVRSGETLAIVGRSGCGKTTLLKLLAGLMQPDGGNVLLDGVPAGAPGKDRMMVFQSFDQLFAWRTLRGNLTFAVRRAGVARGAKAARALADECLTLMGLADAGDKYPAQLSGGMKQRGALARAAALSPRVLLLDEPFASLDAVSRENAYRAFAALKAATGAATVIVTHDLDEAAALADRIALLTPEALGLAVMLDNRSGIADTLRGLLAEPPDTGTQP
jgi:NitT/TauT family transport system ATP-binding protein